MGGTLAQVTNMVDLELAIRLETRQLWSITGAKKTRCKEWRYRWGEFPQAQGPRGGLLRTLSQSEGCSLLSPRASSLCQYIIRSEYEVTCFVMASSEPRGTVLICPPIRRPIFLWLPAGPSSCHVVPRFLSIIWAALGYSHLPS